MNTGDIVALCQFNRWGGSTPTGKHGVLIKRTYMTHEAKYNRWDVLVSGYVINLEQRTLKVL